MALGRTEFHRNLEKWQDFFEETQDDFYEFESRTEKLEALVEILSTNYEEIESKNIELTKEVEKLKSDLGIVGEATLAG